MANIAHTINVLQAMILTDKEKLIVPPQLRFRAVCAAIGRHAAALRIDLHGLHAGQRPSSGTERLGAAQPGWPHPPAPRFPSA